MTGVLLGALVLLAALLQSAVCASGPHETRAPALLSENHLERQAAYDGILADRQETIQELMSVVGRKDIDTTVNGPLHKAILLLGKLRATEAVTVLSSRLTYLPDYPGGVVFVDEMGPREAYYPCALALRDIGEPSIRAMVGTIGQASTSEEEGNLAAWVIMEIEGKEQAAHRFDDLIKQGAPYKEKYEAAKQFIINYKSVFEPPAALTAAKKQPAGADK